MTPRQLVLRLAASLAAVVTAIGVISPVPAGADTATTSRAAATSPTSIKVTWAPTTAPVTSWVVHVTRTTDGSVVGRQTVCGTCSTATFDYLTPGGSYKFAIAGVGAPTGIVWAATTAATPADPLCAGVTSCVAVDGRSSLGTSTGTGLGLLYGLTPRTDQSRVAPLGLNYHRIAAVDPARFESARRAGGQIDVLISDAWTRYTRQAFGRTKNPWEDWSSYQQFVAAVVQWHLNHGLVPDYWEIQNEPDQPQWYPTSVAGMEPTRERVLQQFEVAHDAIRSVLPDAKIVGPSVGTFDPIPGALVDMVSFLDRAVARDLRFDVLAWHEMGGDCNAACDGGPRGIIHHVVTLRGLLEQRPSLGHPDLHVNEFGGPYSFHKPGTAAGYFAALASSGVTKAGSSCWAARYDGRSYDGCFYDPGTMDSMLMPDGTTPTAVWWAWRAYAQMTTGDRLAASASLVGSSVVATRSAAGTIDLLVGRHGPSSGNAQVRVRVAVPVTVRKVQVEATSIPHTIGSASPTTTSRLVRVSNGMADLGALTMSPDAALVLRITGADSVSTTALRSAGS